MTTISNIKSTELGLHESFFFLIATLVVMVMGFQVWWEVWMGCCVVSMSFGKQNQDYPLRSTVACVNISCRL